MKKLLLNEQDVIIDICAITQEVENGLLIDDRLIYAPGTYSSIVSTDTVPDYVTPQKYKFVSSAFVLNENYVAPDMDRISELEQQNAQIILALVEGGLM